MTTLRCYEIVHRRTGEVLLSREINAAGMHDASLQGLSLRGADLRRADLRGIDCRKADLRGADLRHANLHGADLRHANLRFANLLNADLIGANLLDIDLDGAILRGAAGIVDGGAPDGWYAYGWRRDHRLSLRIGCRELRLDEARKYWEGKFDRLEVLAAVEYIAAVATIRGWLP